MEHVLFLEDNQLGKDLLDCSECRLGIRNPGLSAITSRDVFEMLVSTLLIVDPSLTLDPVLVHFIWICASKMNHSI